MRLRQVEQFLLTSRHAGTGDAASAHRDQRLNDVEASLLAVRIGIQKGENAGAPKADMKNQKIERTQRSREGVSEITNAHPRHIQDASCNSGAGDGRAEIGLQHDESQEEEDGRRS